MNFYPSVYETGKLLPLTAPEGFQGENVVKCSVVSGSCWHSGSLAIFINIVGNRPKVNYEYAIVHGTQCHRVPISSLPRAADKPQDEQIEILLSGFSCPACDQKLGKKVWVPYRLHHLYVMSIGWQSWRREGLF